MSQDTLQVHFDRVRRLVLRIQKTPQATASIRAEAQAIGSRLQPLEKKLKAAPGSQQYAYVISELESIKDDLHELFASKLNPLMEGTGLEHHPHIQ